MTRHIVKRVDNLLYKGCEPHWQCTLCGESVPFHCYSKEELEKKCCNCNKICCDNCENKISD